MLFRQIFDERLAQYAYLIGCQSTKQAIVIDPERDIDQYVRLAEQEGLTITAVAETHIHADFLSGVREFANRYGLRAYLSDEGDADWKSEWAKESGFDVVFLRDGDTFRIGNIELKAVHTPGHTPEHMSYIVTDHGGGADEPMGIATGDFVFVGDLGRPDLLESAAKVPGMMDPSARQLYRSVQEFLKLPDFVQVWPGHGAGSACGKALGAVPQTTVGYERRYNASIAAAAHDEDAFVHAILEGQPEPPLYFARMKRLNKEGVPLLGELPAPRKIGPGELGGLSRRDDVVVIDTRSDRSAFMAGHLPGALYAPLNKMFNTVVGSLVVDPETPLYLVVEEHRVEEAVRDLVRIGFDNVVGFIEPDAQERYFTGGGEVDTINEIDFEQAVALLQEGDAHVVDVRYASEHVAGSIPGAVNVAYTRLAERLDVIWGDGTIIVHCGSGVRAAVASAFLKRVGRQVTYVNDEFANWSLRRDAATEGVA